VNYKSAKKGWMKVLNKNKFIMQTNESKSVMNSIRLKDGEVEVNYKSSLEFKAFRYCDMNKYIKKWSLEPFSIQYYKPTTKKFHRYFVDLYIEFENSQKFLVEVKSYKETIKPTIPKKKTQKAMINYNKAEETYMINLCKWKAAEAFCQERGIRFLILTERELK
jgi:hemerythrin superfamily protein